MKKVIIAGILILAVCTAFLVGRQSTSRADIALDLYMKPYPVPFGEWVYLYLKTFWEANGGDDYYLLVGFRVNNKTRYVVEGVFNNTENGRKAYRVYGSIQQRVKEKCALWTAQGYPISLNDFEINLEKKW